MTKFNEEELTKIKTLQDKYQVLGIQLVQLTLAESNAKKYIEDLNQKKSELYKQIEDTSAEEKSLAEELNNKYGVGTLNLESGEFTPNV